MTVRTSTLDQHVDIDAALVAYYTADAAAFGGPLDAAQLDAKRPLIRPDRFHLAELDGRAVGGSGSFPVELTLPGGVAVPCAAVSDVGVVPTHRRRGVLSALLARQLPALAAGGEPLAVLHASEGGIYRRFGFGPATRWHHVRADARRVVFRDDAPVAEGELLLLGRNDALEPCAAVHERVRRTVVGGMSRSPQWWSVVLGDTETYIGGGSRRLVMLHTDGSEPDGYAIYEVREDWSSGQAAHRLVVWELVGVRPDVELALWRALLGHDLVATVTGPLAVDHPLRDVVRDPRQIRLDWEQDLLWARILDVTALLSTRRYRGSGRLVLDVDDPFLADVGGRFVLEVDDGVGRCTRSDATADLEVSIDDLGSVLLGDGSWRRIARAGRIRSRSGEQLELADRLFGVDPLPWCWVRF